MAQSLAQHADLPMHQLLSKSGAQTQHTLERRLLPLRNIATQVCAVQVLFAKLE